MVKIVKRIDKIHLQLQLNTIYLAKSILYSLCEKIVK